MTIANDPLEWMIRTQLESRGIHDPRVLETMRSVDRARFVPPELATYAYDDRPLGIGEGQTISQPYMVGLMTQTLDLSGRERVLEIGTGSGYQTAILARLAAEVYTIEYHRPLIEKAEATLRTLGYANVQYLAGNGRQGWAEAAPFDRILCAAAAPDVPYRWLLQLADPGILVMPVGGADLQTLVRIENRDGRTVRTEFCPCRFVPLVGDAGEDLAPPTGGAV
jgi:protein-L-isoaspartate(D-aspartate) O-methyltransferase